MVLIVAVGAVWANGTAEKKPIVWVWLPNDSPPESAQFRTAMDKIVQDAIGRPVQDKLTTDYNIAIQAMTSDNAAIALFGAYQYVKCSADQQGRDAARHQHRGFGHPLRRGVSTAASW